MIKKLLHIQIVLLLISIFFSFSVKAQLFAPNRDWASQTSYLGTIPQDSIFIFFQNDAASLRAQFSDSSAASYKWYWYNKSLGYQERFQEISGQTDSVLLSLTPGGYRVEATRISDDITEVYTAWVMVDEVELESISLVKNTCSGLELSLITEPNFFDVQSLFTYYDLSREAHQELNVLGANGYFDDHTFESTNNKVVVNQKIYSLPFVFVEYENSTNGRYHGPLYESAYRFTYQNPFGKGNVMVETPTIDAVSTKADFEIRFWDEEQLLFGSPQTDDIPSGEALLEMELKSTAVNSDSLFWTIHNDKLRIAQGADSLIWRDSSLFNARVESYPEKRKLVPGFYEIEHVSVKHSGDLTCIDSLFRTVEVDTSFIQNIPNVFTPGGMYPYFKIEEDDLRSLKSFKIAIMSRSGKQVYRYVGDPKQWEGWNGKLDGTKGDVPAGVYYYVIDAVGWDGVRYRNGQYKGFLHLYR